MKNLIIKLSLVVIMAVACNSALAVFTDSLTTLALWHCDETNWVYSSTTNEFTPDDNSSGRTAHPLQINQQNEAIMMTNSPYGGNYLAFDGTVHATAWGALDPMPTTNLHLSVSVRLNALPTNSDTFVSIFWTGPIRVMLWNLGGATKMSILRYDGNTTPTWLQSDKLPNTNVWYTVDVVSAGTTEQLIFGNDTEGYATNSITVGEGFWDGADFVCVGWDPQGANRELDGDVDEMLIDNVPEPFYLSFIIYYLLFIIRRKFINN